jgi:hypothetical protein
MGSPAAEGGSKFAASFATFCERTAALILTACEDVEGLPAA